MHFLLASASEIYPWKFNSEQPLFEDRVASTISRRLKKQDENCAEASKSNFSYRKTLQSICEDDDAIFYLGMMASVLEVPSDETMLANEHYARSKEQITGVIVVSAEEKTQARKTITRKKGYGDLKRAYLNAAAQVANHTNTKQQYQIPGLSLFVEMNRMSSVDYPSPCTPHPDSDLQSLLKLSDETSF